MECAERPFSLGLFCLCLGNRRADVFWARIFAMMVNTTGSYRQCFLEYIYCLVWHTTGGKVTQVCLLAKDCSSLRSGFLSCDASILKASSFSVFLCPPTGTWESRRVPVQSSFYLLSYKDPWYGCRDSSTPRVVVNMAWSNSLAFKQTKIFNHFRVVDEPLTWFPCVTWNTKFLDEGGQGEHWRWSPLPNSGVFLPDRHLKVIIL